MMTRILSAICASAALAFSASLMAQTTTSTAPAQASTESKVTLEGCLTKNNSGGFWLTKSKATADEKTAPTGTAGQATPRAGTSQPSSSLGASSPAATWNLEHGLRDLDKYVGQKVEVVGKPKATVSGDQPQGAPSRQTTGAPEPQVRDFAVDSVKMIAATCS